MGPRILATCITLATLFACVRADGLDDFTNNLFSDLGPILALFGERVTMQFMSQAMDWVDCIALAMAPLGIITVLVSAIRVGGPPWLKAVIGRARENTAAAEMELMSSTSEEVCELFNGNSFIRCQGTAPVWEYICIIPKNANSPEKMPLQFMTLDDAVEKGLLSTNKGGTQLHLPRNLKPNRPEIARDDAGESTATPNTGNATHGTWSGAKRWFNPESLRRRGARDAGDVENQTNARFDDVPDGQTETTKECITVIRQITDNAPNITINLQKTNLRKSNTNLQKTVGWTWINYVAGLGGLLQAGVLAFFGVMSYDPRLQPDFRKDGKPAASYGFPLAAGGTVLLVAGMFLCGLVVENSTEEEVYKAKEDHGIRIYWLQQNQTVSDQVFESFAVFPKQDLHLTSIIKSTRHRDLHNASEDSERLTGLQRITMFGVLIGLLGFIIQFTGLRAMNSAASLTQLAAVAIMTGCRAFVRPGFSSSFERQKLLSGFELDWLAWKLMTEKENSPAGQENGQPESNEQPKPDKPITGTWAVLTGEKVEYEALEPLATGRERMEAHDVLVARRELCKLAKFQGQTSTEAINLAIAIEAALHTLFPDGPPISAAGESSDSDTSHNQQGKGFRWLVNATYSSPVLTNASEQETQGTVSFDLNYTDNSWHVLADSLDAALSLWVYTIREREKQQSDRNKDENTNCVGKENDEWLRHKVPQPCLRLIDPSEKLKAQLLQDLEWWAPQSTEYLFEVKEDADLTDIDSTDSDSTDTDSTDSDSTDTDSTDTDSTDTVLTDRQMKPTNSKVFHTTRVVGCSPSSTSNTKAQKRSFRIFPPSMKNNKRILAIESRDSLEHLYAKDLLFSFMCSAAKTPGVAIKGVAELRTAATSNRAPKILWHRGLARLADFFSSSSFGTGQEALMSIIAPLSMGGILPFPYALLESMRNEVAEYWQSGNERDACKTYGDLLMQIECYASGNSGLYESMLAFLLEVQNDVAYQVRSMESDKPMYRPVHTFQSRLKRCIERSIKNWKVKPEFFCEFERLLKKSGRQLTDDLSPFSCNRQGDENSDADDDFDSHHGFTTDTFPPYFNLAPSHIPTLEGSFAEEQAEEKDFCGRTPLHYAAMNDRNSDALRRYLFMKERQYMDVNVNVDINVKDHRAYTPLHYACALGRVENVTVLLNNYAKLDNQGIDGMCPMHLAAREGHVKIIKKILHRDVQRRLTDAQRRRTDYNGYLPIHWGAINGHVRIIQRLDADINVASAENDTPLHLAVLHGKVDVVEVLLELPVDKEKTNNMDETALLLALYMGELEIAKKLIEKGANPNLVGRFGDTPLHGLISPRYVPHNQDGSELRKVAAALVKNGADLWAKNNRHLLKLPRS